MKKLTLVSVVFGGFRRSLFVMADVINGKSVVSPSVVSELTKDIPRGATFSFGA